MATIQHLFNHLSPRRHIQSAIKHSNHLLHFEQTRHRNPQGKGQSRRANRPLAASVYLSACDRCWNSRTSDGLGIEQTVDASSVKENDKAELVKLLSEAGKNLDELIDNGLCQLQHEVPKITDFNLVGISCERRKPAKESFTPLQKGSQTKRGAPEHNKCAMKQFKSGIIEVRLDDIVKSRCATDASIPHECPEFQGQGIFNNHCASRQ